jgi:hypothetical protein
MGVPGNANPLLLRTVTAAATGISRSLRFNAADSAYLSRTPASAGNRRTWTFSCWVKRSNLGTFQSLFNCIASDASHYTQLIFETSDKFVLYDSLCSGVALTTTQVFRDTSAWFHFLLYYDTTQSSASAKVKLYVNGAEVTQFDTDSRSSLTSDSSVNRNAQHVISGRLPFTGGSSGYLDAYLTDIYFIDGQALDPTSFGETDATTGVWNPKAYTGSYGTNGFHLEFADNSAATATTLGKDTSGNGNNWTPNNLSVLNGNGTYSTGTITAGTNDGTISQAFNGVLVRTVNAAGITTSSGNLLTYTLPSTINYSSKVEIAGYNNSTGTGYAGLGTADPTGGVSVPNVSTGNSVPWTTLVTGSGSFNAISVRNSSERVGWVGLRIDGVTILLDYSVGAGNDSLVDVPSSSGTDTGVGNEVRGNYCTLNPLDSQITLVNGNLENSASGSASWKHCRATMAMTSGKWYWEHTVPGPTSGSLGYLAGVATAAVSLTQDPSSSSTGIYARQTDNKYSNGTNTTPFTTTASGDVLMFAFNADTGKLWSGKNGTWESSGNPAGGTNESWSSVPTGVFPFVGHYQSGINYLNFGQRAFAYTAPSGFKALNTASLPSPSVTKPSTVFDAVTYTGNGSSKTISGLGFSPDLVWIKGRSAAYYHYLQDTVRGNTKILESNTTGAEYTDTTALTSFNSDGFSLGNSSGNAAPNVNNVTYVAWNWDAGSSTVTNTAGSITSSVRANATAGFSVVTWTGNGTNGATVGHGLGVAPGMVIVKNRTTSGGEWAVYHSKLSSGYLMWLNLANGEAAISARDQGGVGSVSSTTFTCTQGSVNLLNVNTSSNNYVAYCFAPVAGYSSFGSYTGNGSSDGPFVFTGMRPRWLLIKPSSTAEAWALFDTARDSYNQAISLLEANVSGAENATSVTAIDILSNGFKLRNTRAALNGSGTTYIYAAFAESPFNYARAR